jgi:hypothetical protein
MKKTRRVTLRWPLKTTIGALFFAFWVANCEAQLGLPPLINVPPADATVQNGGTATFTTTIGVSLTPLTITWRLNGTNIANPGVVNTTVPILGTTISTLTITNCSAADAGYYSAKVQNGGGSVTAGPALLTVLDSTTSSNVVTRVSILTGALGMTNSGFQLQLIKPANSNCVLEASVDLRTWTPIYTNTSVSTNVSYLDTAATNFVARYYRARLQ